MTIVIAEAGINHNGSVTKALEMIEVAVVAGADYIKFQTYVTENLLRQGAPKAPYQVRSSLGGETQHGLLAECRLTESEHILVKEACDAKGIGFLSTAFDIASANFLIDSFNPDFLKIPSGEITNAEYLFYHGSQNRPILMSTGMSDEREIEDALGVIAYGLIGGDSPSKNNCSNAFISQAGQKALQEKVHLLHCVSEYPPNTAELNLLAIPALKKRFQLKIGYSDHSSGICAAIGATALGAEVIEKHFTLSRKMEGPDHQASLEPEELSEMVRSIHELDKALGSGRKQPTKGEDNVKSVARKSLVASRAIRKGEYFTRDNLTAKRPGTGRSAMDYWELIGQPATREYQQDDFIL